MDKELGIRSETIDDYIKAMQKMIKPSVPLLNDDIIEEGIMYSIKKRFKDSPCILYNNYKNITRETTLAKIMDYYVARKPISTPYGVLFSRHGDIENPLYDFIQNLADNRQINKDEMFKHLKGSELYNRYNLAQLLCKIDMNGLYGVSGAPSSIFFNLHIAASITTTGRSIIGASIIFFEQLLSNNVKFGSLDEIVIFIYNILEDERRFPTISQFIDHDISAKQCYMKLLATCGYQWIPTDHEADLLWNIVSRLSQEDINRVYYKNNLFNFCENVYVMNIIKKILCTLQEPFMNPNKPPKEIKEDLDYFVDLIREFVYYKHIPIDKLERVEVMPRDVVLITDTDSCIISLEAWYQFIMPYVQYLDMPIKRMSIDLMKVDNVDNISNAVKYRQTYRFDMVNNQVVEDKKLINIAEIIPEDNVKCSIVDIMSYTISRLVLDFMENFSDMHNTSSDNRKCLLIMKNEFLFKSILLTFVKKCYVTNIMVQEGNMVPKSEALNVAGLELNKSNVPESTSDALKKILFEEIVDSDNGVDQMQVLTRLAELEKRIVNTIKSGGVEYYKCIRVKPITAYANPMKIQGIKGSYAYNMLKPDDEQNIDVEKYNSLYVVSVDIDKTTINNIKEKNIDLYNKIVKLMERKEFSDGVKHICIPSDIDIPEWVLDFVDINSVVLNNIGVFPMEELGLNTMGNKYMPYSNYLTL